ARNACLKIIEGQIVSFRNVANYLFVRTAVLLCTIKWSRRILRHIDENEHNAIPAASSGNLFERTDVRGKRHSSDRTSRRGLNIQNEDSQAVEEVQKRGSHCMQRRPPRYFREFIANS